MASYTPLCVYSRVTVILDLRQTKDHTHQGCVLHDILTILGVWLGADVIHLD